MALMNKRRPATPGGAVRSPEPNGLFNRLDEVWSTMSPADREVFLGHSDPLLSAADRLQLAKLLAKLGSEARRGSR